MLSTDNAGKGRLKAIFSEVGYEVNSVHRDSDALMNADAFLVGGGNTFNLLKQCQDRNLMEPLKDRVLNDNIPYIGLSAGTNLACPDHPHNQRHAHHRAPELKCTGVYSISD